MLHSDARSGSEFNSILRLYVATCTLLCFCVSPYHTAGSLYQAASIARAPLCPNVPRCTLAVHAACCVWSP
ncbi:hypothetical protein E2C01_097853 [Portunus trituberculatus]|uniref:Uncharacterized protein n=1 Tax=Portunus trituberculatus TaxID=210409 RepID=A0A5B7KB59_PORTR|nr:hypothetical protein [Portunus trituberculatus]